MTTFGDRIALVTGAGSGIGKSTAIAFSARGAKVHVVDLDGARAEETVAAIRKRGGSADAHTVDCADPDAVTALAEAIGPVDILQNGVGVLVAAPVEDLTAADFRRAMHVNYGSVVNGITAFLPGMLERGTPAHIVNIASVAGLVAFPFTVPYTASKYAVVGLSEALTYELAGRPVQVTTVCPGMVRSNLVADGRLKLPPPWPDVFDKAYATIAASPDRIAASIVDAVEANRALVVPSLLLSQLWRLQRTGGAAFRTGARSMSGVLQRVGGWVMPS